MLSQQLEGLAESWGGSVLALGLQVPQLRVKPDKSEQNVAAPLDGVKLAVFFSFFFSETYICTHPQADKSTRFRARSPPDKTLGQLNKPGNTVTWCVPHGNHQQRAIRLLPQDKGHNQK